MHIFQELKTLTSHIYFKTIVINNLHLFRKWRGYLPRLLILGVSTLKEMERRPLSVNRGDTELLKNYLASKANDFKQQKFKQDHKFILKNWLVDIVKAIPN